MSTCLTHRFDVSIMCPPPPPNKVRGGAVSTMSGESRQVWLHSNGGRLSAWRIRSRFWGEIWEMGGRCGLCIPCSFLPAIKWVVVGWLELPWVPSPLPSAGVLTHPSP